MEEKGEDLWLEYGLLMETMAREASAVDIAADYVILQRLLLDRDGPVSRS